MIFNDHSRLAGSHSFLSASSYHWINYDEEKLDARYLTALAAARGTRLHEFAQQAITLGIKLKGTRQTLNMFVNDCIGFSMVPEQVLYYSDNAFGTADAIKFVPGNKNKRPRLLIFDLKTGVTPASMKQLYVYAAYFCLEYGFKPVELDIELRIYQNDDVIVEEAEPLDVTFIMDRIVIFDKRIEALKAEVL